MSFRTAIQKTITELTATALVTQAAPHLHYINFLMKQQALT